MLRDVVIGLVVYVALAGPLAVIVGKGLRRSREAFERDERERSSNEQDQMGAAASGLPDPWQAHPADMRPRGQDCRPLDGGLRQASHPRRALP